MRARTSTVGDVEIVFGSLSQRLSNEYHAAGLGTQEVQDTFNMSLGEGRAYTLLDGDAVVGIIAWNEIDDVARTIFAARESFFSAASVRFCKRHIRHVQALTGNLIIEHHSWLDRPEVARWFHVIGFEKATAVGGSTLYQLPPARS